MGKQASADEDCAVNEDRDLALFETIVNEHQGILYKIANSYTNCLEDKDDLLQEISYQLWRSLDSYQGKAKLSTWVYKIALNTAISYLRSDSAKKQTQILSARDVSEEETSNTNIELMIEIQNILLTLNKFDRALIIMHLDGLDYSEIAEVLNISSSNVSTKLSRIKQHLNKQFNKR
jgi:RNA polymerase sigma-70 factor (ECF subfamily)